MSKSKIYDGEIAVFFKTLYGGGGYGFLKSDVGRFYFLLDDCEPDNIGRKLFARNPGSPVRFRVEKYLRRGQPETKAVEVGSMFPTDIQDPESHREVAVVEKIVRGSVFLRRESGDQLHLCRAGVAVGHEDRFDNLNIGDHVWCGAAPPIDSRHPNWSAVHAELYSPTEENEIRIRSEAEFQGTAQALPLLSIPQGTRIAAGSVFVERNPDGSISEGERKDY